MAVVPPNNTNWMSPGKGGMQNWGGGAPGAAGMSATNPIVRMIMAQLVQRGILPQSALNQAATGGQFGQPAMGTPGAATNAGLLAALLRLAPHIAPSQLAQIMTTMMNPANRVNPAQVNMLPNLAQWSGPTFPGTPAAAAAAPGGGGGTTAGGGGGGGGGGGREFSDRLSVGPIDPRTGLAPGQGVVQGLGPDIVPGVGPVTGPTAGQGIPNIGFGGQYTGAEKQATAIEATGPYGGQYTGAERTGGASQQAMGGGTSDQSQQSGGGYTGAERAGGASQQAGGQQDTGGDQTDGQDQGTDHGRNF
jgi:hypothetical protein